jgi:hypothetical protein
MASNFQQRSRMRKMLYAGAILLLFTGTLFWRLAVVETFAQNLHLREQDLGHVELTGKTVQLLSTGVRGAVVCGLWWAATEEQRRKDWPELENLTDSLAVLQPHFLSVWLFQSWNLTYNVSVISDQATDQYYYIARGIELLSRGERQNQDQPDLRFTMGYYYQDKFGQADKRREYRALFCLSCIDPRERSAAWLKPGDKLDPERFEAFAKKHPQLVRRIRRIRGHQSAEDVVDFLEANVKIPTRYETVNGPLDTMPPQLKPYEKRFPILPPRFEVEGDPRPENGLFDSFSAGREWFIVAQEPLPPPVSERPLPQQPPFDRSKYRLPRYMAVVIFRSYPAHAETYLAGQLEKEGWFDPDGWTMTNDDGFPELAKGKDGTERTIRVGDTNSWAADAWNRAYEKWRVYGVTNALYIEDIPLANLRSRARPYAERFQLSPERDPIIEPPASMRGTPIWDGYEAYKDLYWYRSNRQLTNFAHFYFQSQTEADELTIAARKNVFLADQLQELGSYQPALRMYRNPPRAPILKDFDEPRTLEAWRTILLKHPDFRDDHWVQEETYKTQRNYLRLAFGEFGEGSLTLQHYLGQATAVPAPLIALAPVKLLGMRRVGTPPVKGPLELTNARGDPPVINPGTALQVLASEAPPPGGPASGQQAPPGVQAPGPGGPSPVQ